MLSFKELKALAQFEKRLLGEATAFVDPEQAISDTYWTATHPIDRIRGRGRASQQSMMFPGAGRFIPGGGTLPSAAAKGNYNIPLNVKNSAMAGRDRRHTWTGLPERRTVQGDYNDFEALARENEAEMERLTRAEGYRWDPEELNFLFDIEGAKRGSVPTNHPKLDVQPPAGGHVGKYDPVARKLADVFKARSLFPESAGNRIRLDTYGNETKSPAEIMGEHRHSDRAGLPSQREEAVKNFMAERGIRGETRRPHVPHQGKPQYLRDALAKDDIKRAMPSKVEHITGRKQAPYHVGSSDRGGEYQFGRAFRPEHLKKELKDILLQPEYDPKKRFRKRGGGGYR